MISAEPIKIQMREWERYPAEKDDLLKGLTLPENSATHILIRALSQQNKLHIREYRHGMSLESTSFVGRLTIGPLEITVQPKLNGLPLMRLMRYAYGLSALGTDAETDFDTAALSFQDLLIYQLGQETKELLSRGLRLDYLRHELALSSPRGRINISRLARNGGMTTAELPCIIHDRREDVLLNQVLLAGLSLGARVASDVALRAGMRRLSGSLEDAVSPIRLVHQIFTNARRRLTRLTSAYKPALTLIELLWQNEGIALEGESRKVLLPGFLFDMNKFFQAMLSRFLRENLPNHRLEDEHRLHSVFSYNPNFNPCNQRAPTPRPDYAIWKDCHLVSILDAKYRDLSSMPLPPAWLYQLSIYAMSQEKSRTATILYATTKSYAQESRIDLRNPVSGKNKAQVILRPVDLCAMDELLNASPTPDVRRRRAQMASDLALGQLSS